MFHVPATTTYTVAARISFVVRIAVHDVPTLPIVYDMYLIPVVLFLVPLHITCHSHLVLFSSSHDHLVMIVTYPVRLVSIAEFLVDISFHCAHSFVSVFVIVDSIPDTFATPHRSFHRY